MRSRTLACTLLGLAAAAACGRSGGDLRSPNGTPTPTPSPTDLPSPTFRKTLTLDGGRVEGSHTGFPVLVVIEDDPALRSITYLGNVTDDAGGDLGFTQDGLTLSHEIERYDPQTGTLVAWVRVPTLVQGTNDDLSLELGGPIRTSTALSVWDAEFEAVWHLSGLGDSTSHVRNLTDNGAGTANGQVAGAATFDGVDDYLSYPTAIDLSGEFTVSAWMKLGVLQADLGDFARVVERWSGSSGGYGLFFENVDNPEFGVHAANGTLQDNATPTLTFNAGTWYYAVGVWRPSPGEKAVHSGPVGGSFNKNGATSALSTTLVTPSGPVLIGGDPNSNSNPYFSGSIDEVRIVNVARSDAWIRTEFANQSDPTGFVTVGPLETVP